MRLLVVMGWLAERRSLLTGRIKTSGQHPKRRYYTLRAMGLFAMANQVLIMGSR